MNVDSDTFRNFDTTALENNIQLIFGKIIIIEKRSKFRILSKNIFCHNHLSKCKKLDLDSEDLNSSSGSAIDLLHNADKSLYLSKFLFPKIGGS